MAVPSEIPVDFRAPPPSPVASGRRSCVTNDDVLTDFLEHSLRVPDLVLPDKVFPRQKLAETPPIVDFETLRDSAAGVLESVARIGCFQLSNHGISWECMDSVRAAAAGVFRVPPEKKATLTKSPEKPFGFEEVHGEDEESGLSEEFVWCRNDGLKVEMERIWPDGCSDFREKMESLTSDMEKVADKILRVIWGNSQMKTGYGNYRAKLQDQAFVGSVCCVYKHTYKIPEEKWANSFRHDVIRTLIKGTDYSHALCLHICDGSSNFHVYSKKGWVSFCPEKDVMVITVGDQVQASSGGQYKHVIGRPIYKVGTEDCISMAFLYSPSPPPPPPPLSSGHGFNSEPVKTISMRQQVIAALILTLVYQFLVYLFKN